MKHILFFIGFIVLMGFASQAQLPTVKNDPLTSTVNPGKLLTQFSGALKPASLSVHGLEKKTVG